MAETLDGLCVTCNDRDGVVRRLETVARDGERRQYELVLCGVCTDAFDDADSTTVEAATDTLSAD